MTLHIEWYTETKFHYLSKVVFSVFCPSSLSTVSHSLIPSAHLCIVTCMSFQSSYWCICTHMSASVHCQIVMCLSHSFQHFSDCPFRASTGFMYPDFCFLDCRSVLVLICRCLCIFASPDCPTVYELSLVTLTTQQSIPLLLPFAGDYAVLAGSVTS